MARLLTDFVEDAAPTRSDIIKEGGGAKAIARQHEKGRLTARERIARLLDPTRLVLRAGPVGRLEHVPRLGRRRPRASSPGIGSVAGRRVMIIANDATVKAGAFFPLTCKKVLRAQRIAMDNRLPLVYLVDSAGVFLPLQDEVFPDEDDFGRIFRNNAVISAAGIPAVRSHPGQLRRGRRLPPRPVRQAADDRRQRPVPGGPGPRQGGHRPGRQP